MKKLFVVSLFVVNLPAFATQTMVTQFENACSSSFGSDLNAVFELQSATCESGYFLPANSATCAACPDGYTCPGGTYYFKLRYAQGLTRTAGLYTTDEAKACASNFASDLNANFELAHPTCASGYFLPANSDTCAPCPTGYTCPGGTYYFDVNDSQGLIRNATLITTNTAYACAANYPSDLNANFEAAYTCASGTFLPANSDTCATCPTGYTCPGGTFIYSVSKSQGATRNSNTPYTTNQTNMCASNFSSDLNAVFDPMSVTCTSGKYLPMLSTECVDCLTGHTCGGGTFEYSKTINQGIVVNQYNCNAGTYLPANATVCATCPADFYCGGDTYTFNATVAQGLTACDSGTHSPAGASSSSQCIEGYTCTSGQYLPKNTTVCVACPNGYTCAGGTYNLDANNDQGIVGNTITITWNGALQSDIETNNAGTVIYGGDIRTPVRADPAQIPAGKRFVGWVFRKSSQN